MVPDRLKKTTRKGGGLNNILCSRRCHRGKHSGGLALLSGVYVALNHQCVFCRRRAVRSKAATQQVPTVYSIRGIEARQVILVEIFCENAVVRIFAQAASVLRRSRSLIAIPAARDDHAAVGTRGSPGDDVDYSIHRVGSPDCSARAA